MKALGVIAIIIVLAGLFFIVMATPNPIRANLPNLPNIPNPPYINNQTGGSEIPPTEDMPNSPSGYWTIDVYQDTQGNFHYFTDNNDPATASLTHVGIVIVPAGTSPDDMSGIIMYDLGYNPPSTSGSSTPTAAPRAGGVPLSMFGVDITVSLTLGLVLVFAGIILFLLFGM